MRPHSLNIQILLATVLGISLGLVLQRWPSAAGVKSPILFGAELISGLFIDLLKMVLAPLVFASIAVGVANLRAQQTVHRIWVSTLAYFGLTSLIAIAEGLFASNFFAPGKGLDTALFQNLNQPGDIKTMTLTDFSSHLLHGLFVNPFVALAQGNVLAIVSFAIFIGVALVLGGDRYQHVRLLLQESLEIFLRIVGWIMRIAPFGVLALLTQLFAKQDDALLLTLAKFVAVVVGSTLFHGVIVLPLLLYLGTGITLRRFWQGAQTALLTAFATSSSAATLAVSMHCAEQNLSIKPEIAGFVLPLGSTLNSDGTALYEAAAALFVAQLAGIELNLLQQLLVCMTAMLGSMGAPGIPSAGMVTMIMVLQSVGLPIEAIGLLLPMDRLLDTVRTAVNVEGDMVGALLVQRLADPVNA